MTLGTTVHHAIRRAGLAALVAAALLSPSTGRAADSQPTTTQECYRSIRSCQKSRCAKLGGQEQVTCMEQCYREYETCARGAQGGLGGGINIPRSEATPGAQPKLRRTRIPHREKP